MGLKQLFLVAWLTSLVATLSYGQNTGSIAGTISDGKSIARTVARIDEDMTIYMVSGMAEGSELEYDASKSTAREIELLPDGRMIELG